MEGNVTLGAAASAVSLTPGEAGRFAPTGTPQRSVLRPDEQARITKNINVARQVMSTSMGPSPSPKGGGGGGAALVLLGLAAAGAGAYILTRPKATEAQPDLVPQQLCVGGAAVIVANVGSAAAPPSTTSLQVSKSPPITLQMASIPPGGTLTLGITPLLSRECSQRCTLTVVVDVNGQVAESDESNNTASATCFF